MRSSLYTLSLLCLLILYVLSTSANDHRPSSRESIPYKRGIWMNVKDARNGLRETLGIRKPKEDKTSLGNRIKQKISSALLKGTLRRMIGNWKLSTYHPPNCLTASTINSRLSQSSTATSVKILSKTIYNALSDIFSFSNFEHFIRSHQLTSPVCVHVYAYREQHYVWLGQITTTFVGLM